MITAIVSHEDLRRVPVIQCDACGDQITNPGLAMVAFDDDLEPGHASKLIFLHKGDCDRSFGEGYRRPGGWIELKHFIARLCHNTGLTAGPVMNEAFHSAGALQAALDPEESLEEEEEQN